MQVHSYNSVLKGILYTNSISMENTALMCTNIILKDKWSHNSANQKGFGLQRICLTWYRSEITSQAKYQ